MSKKTWSKRILNAASKEVTINTRTLRTRLRIPKTEMGSTAFNNTVMRTTRKLHEDKCLKRTDRGEYMITKRGIKALFA